MVPSDETHVLVVGMEPRWWDLRDGRVEEEPLDEPWKIRGKSIVIGFLRVGRQAHMIPVLASRRVHVDRDMKLPGFASVPTWETEMTEMGRH